MNLRRVDLIFQIQQLQYFNIISLVSSESKILKNEKIMLKF
jgi:hypothetical protein